MAALTAERLVDKRDVLTVDQMDRRMVDLKDENSVDWMAVSMAVQ